jgi:hypothetical protein
VVGGKSKDPFLSSHRTVRFRFATKKSGGVFMKRQTKIQVSVLALSMLLAACGGGTTAVAPTTKPADTAAPATAEAAVPTSEITAVAGVPAVCATEGACAVI